MIVHLCQIQLKTCCLLLQLVTTFVTAFQGFGDGRLKVDPVFVTDSKFKSYRLEDFFWTGSGDAPDLQTSFNNDTETDEDNAILVDQSYRTTTVFHTTTVLFATVYPSKDSCGSRGCPPEVSPVWTDTLDFSSPVPSTASVPDLYPTPVQPLPGPTSAFPTIHPPIDSFTAPPEQEISETPPLPPPVPPDQRYWLLTVLRTEESPEIRTNVLEERLSRLYQRAFMRRHREDTGNVRVTIHNATFYGGSDPRDLGLLYTVSVGGQPVSALSAASDMRLLTLSEVSAELGYPVLTKAERKQYAAYLKGVVPFGARVKGRSRDTWLLIGSVVAAVSLLVVLAALFTLGLSKSRARQQTARGAANRRQVYDGEEGVSNLSYDDDSEKKPKSGRSSDLPGQVTFAEDHRRSSTSSSCSGSSEASLVRLRMQQRRREMRREEIRPKPRPRTRVRRVEDVLLNQEGDTDRATAGAGSARSRDTFGGVHTDAGDDADDMAMSPRNTSTPTSYLSMPSVKAFPRKARIPEPLNRVLEPISIRHLDADGDDCIEYPVHGRKGEAPIEARNKLVKGVTRHGSLEGDDPGVIGPVVWDRHCQQMWALQKDDSEDPGGGGVSRIRKRFSELLDDAFSVFGSRSVSPDEPIDPLRPTFNDSRAKSAVVKASGEPSGAAHRPNTTDCKRPQTAGVSKTPRGAWDSPSYATPGRPISARPFTRPGTSTPVIDANLINVDSELSPSDPAVPLIAAIKEELKRFQKPDQS